MRDDKRLGGPANLNLPDFLTLSRMKPGSGRANTGLSTVVRFPEVKRYVSAGPGTYERRELNLCVSHRNQPPPFEWDGFQARSKQKSKGSGLAANRYSVTDPHRKIISTRGPYDLFTGPRDGSTIKNHFAPPKRITPDQLSEIPNEMDRMKRPEHALKGKWRPRKRSLQIPTSRFVISSITHCPKDPNSPSPAHYDPLYPRRIALSINYPGFGIGVQSVRPEIGFTTQPGPGRYHPRRRLRPNRGHRSVFLSKAPRTLSLVKPTLNAF